MPSKIIKKDRALDTYVLLHDMKKGQVGVVDTHGPFRHHHGKYCMRTHSNTLEVIDLSDTSKDSWFSNSCNPRVRLLRKGESVTVRFSNYDTVEEIKLSSGVFPESWSTP